MATNTPRKRDAASTRSWPALGHDGRVGGALRGRVSAGVGRPLREAWPDGRRGSVGLPGGNCRCSDESTPTSVLTPTPMLTPTPVLSPTPMLTPTPLLSPTPALSPTPTPVLLPTPTLHVWGGVGDRVNGSLLEDCAMYILEGLEAVSHGYASVPNLNNGFWLFSILQLGVVWFCAISNSAASVLCLFCAKNEESRSLASFEGFSVHKVTSRVATEWG